jgi:two-component system NtrC family response regulator
VRELINTIEVALMASGNEPTLIINHLPVQIRTHLVRKSVEESNQAVPRPSMCLEPQPENHPPTYKAFRESVLRSAEKEYLQNLMAFSKGSIKAACNISGLGRSRLYNLLKKNNVSRLGRKSS